MIDPIQNVEAFLKIFPGPFKVWEMQGGPVDGPHDADFMVQCQKSCKVLQAHATKAEADSQADALNALSILLERVKTAEAALDLVPMAFPYLFSCEKDLEKEQIGMVEQLCGHQHAMLLLAMRAHTKAKSR